MADHAAGAAIRSHDADGKHRSFERREQHDEADENSEKDRLDRDIRDHGHKRGVGLAPGVPA